MVGKSASAPPISTCVLCTDGTSRELSIHPMALRIARRFRHESPVIHHARYAHVLPDMQQAAAASLSALLHGSP